MIRAFVASQLEKGAEIVRPGNALKKERDAVESVVQAFVERHEEFGVSSEDAELILKYMFKTMCGGVAEGVLGALKSEGQSGQTQREVSML
jgi:hypothetical protein